MANKPDIRAASISISETSLVIELQDGRTLIVPLSWFPDLVAADVEQLADHRLVGDGLGIHWETLGWTSPSQVCFLTVHRPRTPRSVAGSLITSSPPVETAGT